MTRISWMLDSYLAAAIAILAGPDQPEQAIDTALRSLTVHVGKAGVLSAARRPESVTVTITAPMPNK
jgi:archaellum component FlaG (FlaF/FlaG flagellin family)